MTNKQVEHVVSDHLFRRVIAGASAAYSVLHRVPSVEEIRFYSNCQAKSICKVIATSEFKEIMERRGYAWDRARLTPEQEFAVGIITDPSRRGDMSVKLRAAGISHSQYRAWMKQDHFKDFVNKVGEDMLGENIVNVHTSVVNRATNGDINAAKLVYELTGRHDPARQQMADLSSIVSLLLEVITRHVRDVNVLTAITADVETVMAGKTPAALTSFGFEDEVEDAEVITEESLHSSADELTLAKILADRDRIVNQGAVGNALSQKDSEKNDSGMFDFFKD